MTKRLDSFLHCGTPISEELVTLGNGTIPLKVAYYLGNRQPPRSLVSSIRAIVFSGKCVLVVSQKGGQMYILPGGRVQKEERALETLRRELLEETGWTIRHPRMLGWQHFHHLGPKPDGYAYPYPDFLWPIYTAEARDFAPTAIVPDDYVFESHFRPIDEVIGLPINQGELRLLEAAVGRRGA